ncbi:glucans biosynthesis glucosyltransferase MdoH [Solirhodobacter olei]|uniref:glucans biosynthesis glucosyltransferase MdoH n=1 Tax=Solirhodobacter olei TaxID=2493082 RepID=UPI000FDC9AE0|nr:glucans biosynthesis glucosyltransferase MdoH [Solirhodobacter olei]
MERDARRDAALELRRTAALGLSLALAAGAGLLFLQFGLADGFDLMDVVRSVLIFGSTFWLAWGAVQGLAGLAWRAPALPRVEGPITGRTAILVPVYNEDPVVTFARIAAMDESLAATGQGALFDFAILSDTRDEAVAEAEQHWFLHLLDARGAEGRIFYRRRARNTGKKAGNVEDFITTSGGAYDYALILDADSLMEGATIVEMVRRMEAVPDLGLLQTLPKIIRARSRFGRAQQFSASFFSPIFARGLALMAGRTGPFWGHNALVRTQAFASACGLPALSGQPPFGGHILSHDYVEAALLARAGWLVRLDPDLEGSFEEGPENIVDFAKRDRRWCQGNLQHGRLLDAPGLRPWSRFVFLQGILAYVAPLLWLGFILASIAAPLFVAAPNYFPEPYLLFPVFPSNETSKAMGLAFGVFGLLLLPKLMIAAEAAMTGRARPFGGGLRGAVSTLWELALSSLIAPVMLMFTTRSVLQVLMRIDAGWPPNNRGDGTLSLSDAWIASRWIVATGLLLLGASWALAPELVLWLLPVSLPMMAAPLLIAWTSRPGARGLLRTGTEGTTPEVVATHDHILAAWQAAGARREPALTV